MNKLIPILLLVALVCAGCSTRYSIILNNGDVITSRGKPQYNEKGYYLYKDMDGQTNVIFASRVREVAPSSMADKGGTQFLKQ
jgi:hypothetical protein